MSNVAKIAEDCIAAFVGSERYGREHGNLDALIYPLDLDFTLDNERRYYEPKDSFGIPMRSYTSVGVQYNPTRVAAYGLSAYNRYRRSGSEEYRGKFLRCAEWFLEPADGQWRYEFAWSGLAPGWISCMAQGEGISLLVRAYELTGDDRFRQQAIRAYVPLRLPLVDGGVRSSIDGRWAFLEEYPLAEPPHTLNGFLYAMVGVLDLRHAGVDIERELGFSELVSTLEAQWTRWDLGYWSAYDLGTSHHQRRNPATVTYHNIHISLVGWLGEVLQSDSLKACADRWTAYARSRTKRLRAFGQKIRYRLEVPASR